MTGDALSRGRILVTGGSGFIGRHVVRELLGRGHDVVVADLDEHPDVATTVGDLCDPAVREQVLAAPLDAVVHLAAQTSVLGSVEQPALVHRTNVEATAGLLELARRRDVDTFVLASTNAVVGTHDGVITEDLPLRPLTPYGATKAAGEMLLSGYAGAFGLRTPVLRLSNVYGPGMQAKDSFVPRMMRAAAAGTDLEVYGDGLQRRDLVHVHDVARAFALAAETWPSGPVIIGSGASITVLDMLAAAREATSQPIGYRHVPAKTGEMRAVVVDAGRARERGWQAEVTIEAGLRQAWDDFCAAAA